MGERTVLVFSARDDAHRGEERATRLVEALGVLFVRARHVRKFGTLDDLKLTAKHKVVSTPLVVVLEGQRELARIPARLPGVEEVQRILGVVGGRP